MARKPTARGSDEVRAPKELLEIPDTALARVPEGQPGDHLLRASVRNDTITLLLPLPLEALYEDTVQLLVDDHPVGGKILVDPYIEDEAKIPMALPADERLVEGPHVINYQLVLNSGQGQVSTGPAGQQFIVDYTSPGAPADPATPSIDPPAFDQAIVDDAVTLERLVIGEDGKPYLPATVKPYHGQAIGDLLIGYIDDKVATEPREVLAGETDKPMDIRYTLAALDAVDGGRHAFTVKVVDRAENPPGFSNPQDLMVRLYALIPNPLPPRVPVAADGLIDYADAHHTEGVQVDIPGNGEVLPDDTIIVLWAGYESSPYPVTASNIGNDPLLSLYVPYAEVSREWLDASGDADERVATDVSYRIMRGSTEAGTPDTPTTVNVNLYVPGGVDPDPETPEHDALYPPTIYSAGGSENFIPIDEQDRPGIFEIPWASRLPGRTIFAEHDIVAAFYGATPLPEYEVSALDMAAAAPLRLALPTKAIGDEGLGTVQSYYLIRRTLSGGGTNVVVSPSRNVTVEDETDLPGGGKLVEGWFPEMNAHLTLGPHEIKDGSAFMGDYEDRRAKDTIRFEFQFIDGTVHTDTEVPIAERYHTGTLTLAADGDPIEYLIPEGALSYPGQLPELMHIHATYHVRRGGSSEAHSPDAMVYLDCRGAEPAFRIDSSPVRIIGTGTDERHAINGDPPYTYVSSDPGVVAVPDQHDGVIVGVADGDATITCTDMEGHSGSYPVSVVGNSPVRVDP